ncbi:hypothetical protein EW146_g9374 [Bondarzewia mesenterica]|uniref:Uncharacterized protein n=1 Tax=Bondarzewia mesenterica TaxID=1095465 RepID=A0A4S4L757_9AGAM|nr:hypothetical protein EW146_g9374 [Bondarzewia mesenterica]
MFVPVALALSFASLVTAQSNNPALQIQAIQAHFSNAGLVPSLLSTFNPSAILNLTYSGVGTISPGQQLTKDQVSPTPQLAITPANSTVKLEGNYTLVMADADVVGTDETKGQTRHWLVNGVTLTGSSAPLNVSTESGVAVTSYAGPAPASGSGTHRYVILLLPQSSNFSPPQNLSTAGVGVSVFNLEDYISSSKLGAPIAGTYIDVEEGTATSTPSATSAVVTSTLPAAQSTGSSSASSSGTSTAHTTSSTHNAALGTQLICTPLAMLAAAFGVLAL